jgi:hypothetical protein
MEDQEAEIKIPGARGEEKDLKRSEKNLAATMAKELKQ